MLEALTRAILLREAIRTRRVDPGQSTEESGRTVSARTNYAVAPGEYITEWIEEHHMDRHDLAWKLGVPVTFVNELLAGAVALDEGVRTALEKLTGIPREHWRRLDSQYWADRERIAAQEHQARS